MNTCSTINTEICTACGTCVEICPNNIITKTDGNVAFPDTGPDLCMACGQCMAVCPTGAVQVKGLSYEKDFFALPDPQAEPDFFNLIRTRRAVRNFKDIPVPREELERIVEAVSFAPPGFPPLKVRLTVVSDPALVQEALPHMISLYDKLAGWMKNPVMRFFIKRQVGKPRFKLMQDHLQPLLLARLPGLKAGTEDTLTRHAPALILFHTDRDGEDAFEDAMIAATYATLAAHAAGLGGSIMSIIPPAVDKSPQLRDLFSIPASSQVLSSVIIGYPRYTYKRGIKRQLAEVTWL